MLKKTTALILLFAMLAACLSPAQAISILSKEESYSAANQELRKYLDGDTSIGLENLVSCYQELNNYKDSTAFWLYASILWNVEQNDYSQLANQTTLLRWNTDFCALLEAEELPTVDELEAYALGRQAEAQGDFPTAVACYRQSINVLDSTMRLLQLPLDALAPAPTAAPAPVPTPTIAPTQVPTPTPTPKPKVQPRTVTDTNLKIGDYYITTYSDKTCTITDYNGPIRSRYNPMIDLSIPSTLYGYTVTAIGNRAFEKEYMVRSITVPHGVTSIGEKAFYSCTAVQKISLPSTVTSIGKSAFDYCKNLTTVNIPDGVTRLENSLFFFCEDLSTIVVPDNITYIGTSVFSNCSDSLIVYVREGSFAHEFLKNTTGLDFTLSTY